MTIRKPPTEASIRSGETQGVDAKPLTELPIRNLESWRKLAEDDGSAHWSSKDVRRLLATIDAQRKELERTLAIEQRMLEPGDEALFPALKAFYEEQHDSEVTGIEFDRTEFGESDFKEMRAAIIAANRVLLHGNGKEENNAG